MTNIEPNQYWDFFDKFIEIKSDDDIRVATITNYNNKLHE